MPSALRGPGQRKSVRWADEAPEEGGFAIGGASLRQLETVYVLEGLGPPKDQAAHAAKSFADQACVLLPAVRLHALPCCMFQTVTWRMSLRSKCTHCSSSLMFRVYMECACQPSSNYCAS